MADIAAGKIEAALDRQASFLFDVLRQNLSQPRLLGKIFRSDNNALMPWAASSQQDKNCKHQRSPHSSQIILVSVVIGHGFLASLFSRSPNPKSAASASNAAGIAPAKMN